MPEYPAPRACRCTMTCLRPGGPDKFCPPLNGVRPYTFPPTPPRQVRPIPPLKDSDLDRFWSKVDRRGADECWPWLSGSSNFGHGRFVLGGHLHSQHRVAYTIHYGPIPEGEGYHGTVVMHSCDNPGCCNPRHLVLGTQQENAQDMADKGRGSIVTKPGHRAR